MSPSHCRQLVFAVAVVALAVAVWLDPRGLRRGARMDEEVRALGEGNGRLDLENRRLAREVVALQSDPRFIERAVREELGFIHPGELLLVLDDPARGATR